MKRYKNIFINMLISIFFSFSFIYSFIKSTVLKEDYSGMYIFILVSFFTLIYSSILKNKMTVKISAGVFSLVVIGVLLFFFKNPDIVRVIESYINGGKVLEVEHKKYILFFIVVIITLLVYIFTVKKFNFYFLLIGGVFLFSIQWMNGHFVKLPFYFFMFFILLSYLKHIYIKNMTENKEDSSEAPISYLLFSVPVCLIVLMFAYLIPPLSTEDIKWDWMDSNIKSAHRYVRTKLNINNKEYFNISSTGFNEDVSRLGGNVNINNILVMKVDAPHGGIYLKGAVRDIYTGYSWESDESELTDLGERSKFLGFNEDLMELSSGTRIMLDRNNALDELFNKITIKITYENLKTNTLFMPSKVENINIQGSPLKSFVDNYGVISSENSLEKDFEYILELYDMSKGSLDNIGIKSNRGFYDKYIETGFETSEQYRQSDSLRSNIRNYEEMSKNIYARYLNLPDNLPERVKNLAIEITSQANNDYDKVKAIEEYLSQNYKYTLKPGSIPQNSDFVDYFLFDKKEGYCTYYASAMTVLTRSLGIPARYVEGYVLPSTPTYGTTYEVTNERAHAWVEVYFEGLGWIPFEPTSSFSQDISNEQVQEAVSSDVEIIQDEPENNQNSIVPENDIRVGSEDEQQVTSTETNSKNIEWKYISVVFLILLLWIMIFSPIKRMITLNKLKRLNRKDRVIKIYDYLLKALSIQGFKMEAGETSLKYAERINEVFNLSEFKKITEIFVKARYSNIHIDDKDLKLINDFYNKFPKDFRLRIGWIKYLFYGRILGIV